MDFFSYLQKSIPVKKKKVSKWTKTYLIPQLVKKKKEKEKKREREKGKYTHIYTLTSNSKHKTYLKV